MNVLQLWTGCFRAKLYYVCPINNEALITEIKSETQIFPSHNIIVQVNELISFIKHSSLISVLSSDP